MAILLPLVPSLVLAVFCAVIPWGTKQIKSWPIVIVFGAGLVLGILGIVFSLAWYPWTDLLVLLVAVSAGLLLSRAIPTKLWPFLLLLLVLSILDVIQIVLTSGPPSPGSQSAGTSTPAAQLYGNFLLHLPWGRYNIGIFDLMLLTAMGEYWRRRGSTLLVALAPGVIGFILALGFGQFIYAGALPLIPFISIGWLCSAGLYYYHHRPNRSRAALNRNGGGKNLQEKGQEEAKAQDTSPAS